MLNKHSQLTPDWGSPPKYVEPARMTMGSIDLDPCSSEIFNENVRATHIFTREDNGLARDWYGNVIVNPPGEDNGRIVKLFWEKLIAEYSCGRINSAIWIGFNINQLQTLQCTRVAAHPMHFPICVPDQRGNFLLANENHQKNLFGDVEVPLTEKKDPGHPNFIAFIPPQNEQWRVEVFRSEFSKLGDVRC